MSDAHDPTGDLYVLTMRLERLEKLLHRQRRRVAEMQTALDELDDRVTDLENEAHAPKSQGHC